MKNTASKYTVLFVLMVYFFGCQTEIEHNSEYAKLAEKVTIVSIDPSTVNSAADVSEVFDVEVIELEDEVGDVFKYLLIEDIIILVDFNQHLVRAINRAGKTLWTLSRGDDFRDIETLENIFVDNQKRQLVIAEPFIQKYYDLDGRYLKTERWGMSFDDAYITSTGDRWVASFGFDNSHLNENGQQHNMYCFTSSGTVEEYLPKPSNRIDAAYRDGEVIVDNGETLQVHENISDQAYTIDPIDKRVFRSAQVKYKDQQSGWDYLQENRPENKYMALIQTGLPMATSIIFNEEYVFTRYIANGSYAFHVHDKKLNVPVANCRKFLIEGKVHEIPYLYSKGTYAYVTQAYLHEHLQTLTAPDYRPTAAWKSELLDLEKRFGENDKKLLVLLKENEEGEL